MQRKFTKVSTEYANDSGKQSILSHTRKPS